MHGFKLARELGSEDKEWAQTEKFIHYLAPQARELGITLCVENLYNGFSSDSLYLCPDTGEQGIDGLAGIYPWLAEYSLSGSAEF